MKETPPNCPFDRNERDIINRYINRHQEIEKIRESARLSSLGHHIIRNLKMKNQIDKLIGLQRASQEMHPDVINDENLSIYQEWVERLVDHIDNTEY